MGRILQTAVSLTLAIGVFTMSHLKIANETKKRSFYEDEPHVVPVPGTTEAALGAELEALGPKTIVDGVTVRSPAPLQSFFKNSRESVLQGYNGARQTVDDWYASYHSTERSVTAKILELHDKKEDLFPNSIYIAISALSGTVFARQRGILAKATFPVVFGLVGFRYFLPETFSRSALFAWKLEKENLPLVASQHEAAINKTQELAQSLEQSAVAGQESAYNGVESVKNTIVKWSGLNLDEEVSKK